MTRDEFKSHVEQAIEDSIQYAEQHVGRRLPRRYCFNWLGAKTAPIPQEDVSEFITAHTYVDAGHIYPCFDIGPVDILDDGRLLIGGYRAGYPPQAWGKNYTGRDGPFVLMVAEKFVRACKRPNQAMQRTAGRSDV